MGRRLARFGRQPDRPRHLTGLGMGAHDARHRVVIGHGQRGQPKVGGTGKVFLGVRPAGQKGEIAGGGQFDKGHGMLGQWGVAPVYSWFVL